MSYPAQRPRSAALAASLAVAVTAALAVSGCGSGSPATTQSSPTTPLTSGASGSAGATSAASPAAQRSQRGAPTQGATLDAAAFAAALATPGTVVLDVRTPAEYASGHLPGALNIDIEAPDFDAKIATLAKAVPYAVYCRSGNRSGVALARMSGLGFSHAYHLGGGIGAWQSAGLPITR